MGKFLNLHGCLIHFLSALSVPFSFYRAIENNPFSFKNYLRFRGAGASRSTCWRQCYIVKFAKAALGSKKSEKDSPQQERCYYHFASETHTFYSIHRFICSISHEEGTILCSTEERSMRELIGGLSSL